MTFFEIFFSVAHLHAETKLFCYYQNFISSALQRNHGGTRKKRYIERTTNERTTNERRTTWTIIRPRQDSFRILGLITQKCIQIIVQTDIQRYFPQIFVITKITYLQPFREIMGLQRKSVTSNDERRRTTTNNDERTNDELH